MLVTIKDELLNPISGWEYQVEDNQKELVDEGKYFPQDSLFNSKENAD